MKTWPAELPLPNFNFKGSNETSVIRTKMDSGQYQHRQRCMKDQDIGTMEWTFDTLQYEQFRAFFAEDLFQGAEWVELVIDLGRQELTTIHFRFTKGYSYSYLQVNHWKVSGTVELDYKEREDNYLLLDGTAGCHAAVAQDDAMSSFLDQPMSIDYLLSTDIADVPGIGLVYLVYDASNYLTRLSFAGTYSMNRGSGSAAGPIALPVTVLDRVWLRVFWEDPTTSGRAYFSYSTDDRATWLVLGDASTAATTSVANPAPLSIGRGPDDNANLVGRVHRMQVYAGPMESKELKLDVDFSAAKSASSSFICKTGQTVTMSGTATVVLGDLIL